MKSKIIFGLLSFLLVIFIVLLFIPENENFKVISSPKIYSMVKSSENEVFEIEFLVNENDTYYFNNDYIVGLSLNSELDQEIIPLILEEISYGNNMFLYDNNEYYLIELKLSIGFDSDDYLINFEKAYLNISYNNEEELLLFIGEFNYLFNESNNTDISLNNLSSTIFKIDNVSTVSGIYIELNNNSNENLVITRFSLGSNSISFNDFYLTEIFNEPTLFNSVEDVLLIEEYNYKTLGNNIDQSILLKENQSVMLYIPISYVGKINYIHRFYFEIEYENNHGSDKLVIDDFPYVSTSNFQENLEESYIIYEIPNQS